MRRHRRHQQQVGIILARQDAARYLRPNKDEIQYARHRIIVLNRPRRNYSDSKGKQHSNMPIMEYLDRGGWGTFSETNTNRKKYAPHGKNTKLCTHREEKTNCNKDKTRNNRNHHSYSRDMEDTAIRSIAQKITRSSRKQ